MTKAVNTENHFVPVHEAHAIEQVVLSVSFAFNHPPPQDYLVQIINETNQFKKDMPGGGSISPVAMGFMGFGLSVPFLPQHQAVAGVALSRSAPDGSIESELRVEHTSVTFRTTRYTRWETIWRQVQIYFDALVGKYMQVGAQISNISQNYVDKFLWQGDTATYEPAKLLRTEGEFVAPHVLKQTDLWHNHTGAFIRIDDHTKRLMNVNIDCKDEQLSAESRRAITITTVLTDIFGQPSYEPISIPVDEVKGFVGRHMLDLHAQNKHILASIITDEMANRIALHGALK